MMTEGARDTQVSRTFCHLRMNNMHLYLKIRIRVEISPSPLGERGQPKRDQYQSHAAKEVAALSRVADSQDSQELPTVRRCTSVGTSSSACINVITVGALLYHSMMGIIIMMGITVY